MKTCSVAILAGGFGTRLRGRIGSLPKSMTPIFNKPLLEYQIESCRKYGFNSIILLVHHGAEYIRDYFGDGAKFGVQINYHFESQPRGTAGALCDAIDSMADQFLVLYGDTYFDVDLREIWNDHKISGSDATLLIHPNDHPADSDLVDVGENNRIKKINPYPHSVGFVSRNLVNAALYVLQKKTITFVTKEYGKFDLAKDVFPELLREGKYLRAYITPEYIKDMGTPERIDKVVSDILNGLPDKLSSRTSRSCIFVDRDGTLNKEVNHLVSYKQLELLPGVGEAVRKVNRAGFLSVCVTNQPVVARGDATFEDIERIHAQLDHMLGEHKAYLDRIYFCPHHPDAGYQGEVPHLKISCDCRKPSTDLIDRAVEDLKIDRQSSWFVGDTTIDIETGHRAGLKTILLRTGYAGGDNKYLTPPDYIMPNFPAAVDWILRGRELIRQKLLRLNLDLTTSKFALIGGPSRAGKSSVAQVLKEIAVEKGRCVHIICLDGWLLPEELRCEGLGVEHRYDMIGALSVLERLICSRNRDEINIPIHNPFTKKLCKDKLLLVESNDFLIIEGVPALFNSDLLNKTDLRIYVDVDHDVRHARLRDEYTWRGNSDEVIAQKIASRELDELPIVENTLLNSNYQIKTSDDSN